MGSDITIGCTPFDALLTGKIVDNIDNVDFSWNFGDGETASGSQVTHTYTQPGKTYTVSLTGKSTLTGCTGNLVLADFLSTYSKPKAVFDMDHDVVYNDKPTVLFSNASSGAKSYLWDFGDQTTSGLKDPSHDYKKMGFHVVLLEVYNEFQCSDTVSHKILVAFNRIFPPNGFSPNAPSLVDREFLLNSEGIVSEGYHFTVLSRWNDLIFEAKDEIKGWDGHMKNGAFAPAGVYVWVLNFTDFIGRKHKQTGTVTLVY